MFLLSFVIDESYDGGITEVHVVSSPYKSLLEELSISLLKGLFLLDLEIKAMEKTLIKDFNPDDLVNYKFQQTIEAKLWQEKRQSEKKRISNEIFGRYADTLVHCIGSYLEVGRFEIIEVQEL
jgi:hypothetical protein